MGTSTTWIAVVVAACGLILQLQEVCGQGYFLNAMCGTSRPSRVASKIMHGQDATIGSAPFIAYLLQDGIFQCGGTIISQRHILTAAHCILPNMTVRLGEYNTNTNPDCAGTYCFPRYEEYAIERALQHKYYRGWNNDIGLLKLARNIEFKAHIMPICLLLNPANMPNRQQYQAFGWGKTHWGPSSSVLQTTKLDLYPNSRCVQKLEVPLTNNQICLGLQGSDTCSGDSGGPLVTQVTFNGKILYLQVGIISFGDNECQSPGVYTYVPNYIGWILGVMRKIGY